MTKSVYTKRYRKLRELLIDARLEAGMSQRELGEALGYDQTLVSKMETGVRRVDLIEFLEVAEVLGIDVDGFIEELRS